MIRNPNDKELKYFQLFFGPAARIIQDGKRCILNSLDLISYMIFAHFQTRRDFYWGRPFSREEGAT